MPDGGPSSNGHGCPPSPERASPPAGGPKGQENGTDPRAEARPSLPDTESLVVFSLSLLALPFLPASNLFFYVGFVMAERILYIPSMGFCLLLMVGLRALWVRLRSRLGRTLLLYGTAALVLLHGTKTLLRNQDWANEELLYRSGITVNPAKGNHGHAQPNAVGFVYIYLCAMWGLGYCSLQ